METREIECDILVLGGGLGGVAAAVRACRMGRRVCLSEENPWIGGQCTSQGVSALDEHAHIEHFGGTAAYGEFRRLIRRNYRRRYTLSERAAAAPFLNPGGGWVSRLCFEPRVGLAALLQMLLPEIEAGRLEIFYHARVRSAQVEADSIRSVTLEQAGYERLLRFRAAWVLDATELGDLLPLLGIPWVSGAESREETGEPGARQEGAAPELVQSFTYPFVVDFRPGEDHTIPKPPDYEYNREHQPYTLALPGGERERRYKFFERAGGLPGSFWTYRRILAAENFAEVSGDLALINWPGNDFKGGNLIGAEPGLEAEILQRAKNLSLGLLYWLQTEVRRDDGRGHGYPELRLRPDVLGSKDGLSQYPYIRESRRIKARKTLVEQEVSARYRQEARAAFFADSAGLGWYPIDLHAAPGDAAPTGPTRPFQIPLGALVPQHLDNLLPAAKNIGTTHITNGCYRLHPVEWNIGEAAGALAAFCLDQRKKPAAVCDDAGLLRAFQRRLLHMGIPLYWYEDLRPDHPAFAAAQLLALEGIMPGDPGHLRFEADGLVAEEQRRVLLERAGLHPDAAGSAPRTRGELARLIAEARSGREG